MTRIIIFILTVIILTNCSDKSKFDKLVFETDPHSLYSSNFPKVISGDTLIEIDVRLIDDLNEIELPAYCGLSPSWTILRFEVVKVNKGKYSEKFIFINYMCLREAFDGKHLLNNKTYSYKLRRTKDYYDIVKILADT